MEAFTTPEKNSSPFSITFFFSSRQSFNYSNTKKKKKTDFTYTFSFESPGIKLYVCRESRTLVGYPGELPRERPVSQVARFEYACFCDGRKLLLSLLLHFFSSQKSDFELGEGSFRDQEI